MLALMQPSLSAKTPGLLPAQAYGGASALSVEMRTRFDVTAPVQVVATTECYGMASILLAATPDKRCGTRVRSAEIDEILRRITPYRHWGLNE